MATLQVENFLQNTGTLGASVASAISAYLIYQVWKDVSLSGGPDPDAAIDKMRGMSPQHTKSLVPDLYYGPALDQVKHTYLLTHDLQPVEPVPFDEISPIVQGWDFVDQLANAKVFFALLAGAYVYVNFVATPGRSRF